MGGCGMEGLMYKKVQPCDFLCHPYAADLIMLTVEVLAHDLEVRAARYDEECPASSSGSCLGFRHWARSSSCATKNMVPPAVSCAIMPLADCPPLSNDTRQRLASEQPWTSRSA